MRMCLFCFVFLIFVYDLYITLGAAHKRGGQKKAVKKIRNSQSGGLNEFTSRIG